MRVLIGKALLRFIEAAWAADPELQANMRRLREARERRARERAAQAVEG